MGPKQNRDLFFCVLGMAALIVVLLKGGRTEAAWQEKLPAKITGASYVGMETCVQCHDKEHKEFELSAHARIAGESDNGDVVQGCETCHGPGSVHSEAGGGTDNILNPRRDPETCFTCHMDKKAEFKLPFHHPVLEGKMTCNDCHSSHGPDARPWTETSLEGPNETCLACHKDQQGPFVFEHEALREGCTSCHKVHGSVNDKMLVIRDSNLCLRCHTQMNFPNVGDSNDSGRFPQGTCFSGGCHTAMHGSNFDDHLRY